MHRYEVLLLDLRGHGETPLLNPPSRSSAERRDNATLADAAADVAFTLNALGRGTPDVVCGHSMVRRPFGSKHTRAQQHSLPLILAHTHSPPHTRARFVSSASSQRPGAFLVRVRGCVVVGLCAGRQSSARLLGGRRGRALGR